MSALFFPSGPQYGVPYVLTGPDGTRAVFNDESDPDYVGMLTDISGFDSPEIRESADDLVEMDGGVHGSFFYGRRPITMEGQIMHNGSTTLRNMQLAKLQRATSAMRGDAQLVWTPDGGVQQYMNLRRQQPLRISGAFNKTFQLAMVAADPRIYSMQQHTQQVLASQVAGVQGFGFDMGFDLDFGAALPSGQLIIPNNGNAESFPVYTITGPGTSPAIVNTTTGTVISLLTTLNADQALIVDTLNRTVTLGLLSNNDAVTNYVKNPAFDVASTHWGNNILAGFTLGTIGRAAVPDGLGFGYRINGSNPDTTSRIVGVIAALTAADMIPVSGGQTWSYGADCYMADPPTGDTGIRLRTYFYDSSLTLLTSPIQTQTGAFTGPIPAGQRQSLKAENFQIPSDGTAYMRLSAYDIIAAVDTVDYYFSNFIAVKGAALPAYFDGDTPGAIWSGTQYDSYSLLRGADVAATGRSNKYGAVDFINTTWGGLVPGPNDVRLSYFSYSSGAKLRVDWRDAWL